MKYKIIISYDGKNYSGYQIQKNAITIQELLEKALMKVLGYDTKLVASGRTDAGVSAIEQVCHMETQNKIDIKRTIGYANSILPNDIRILSIAECSEDFHARFSAKQKTYEYFFYTSEHAIPVYDRIALHIDYPLRVDKMQIACQSILGTHDFSSFCASGSEADSKVRTIFNAEIVKLDDKLYKFVITGDGFLYNMVRIIMGTLIDVGRESIQIEDVEYIINAKDRKQAGKTAEGKALYLKKVEY